jgi:uncharacterized SAM-binding protein YcdF (DUF218 family)
VPASAIWTESQSRTTHENAVYAARVLRSKGVRTIVLVTDAYHMLRSEKCFRKEGLVVIPAACGYRTAGRFKPEELMPGWEPISWNEDFLHEVLGLAWYRLHGWI